MTKVSKKGQFLFWALLFAGWQFAAASKNTCALSDSAKVACGKREIFKQSECELEGCCWQPSPVKHAPSCFAPGEVGSGYSLSNFVETPTGYAGQLTLIGEGTKTYGPDVKKLSLDIIFQTEDIVRVKITDATATRWEIPQSVIRRPIATKKPASLNYKISHQESPFTFEIIRLSDGASVFKLDDNFTFKDQYLEIGTKRNEQAKTFGLGESARLHQALKTNKIYTFWANDVPAFILYQNLYGSYPFYVEMSSSGQAHGAMLMNSNGMDVELLDTSLTFKTIGGIVDLYIFVGPNPVQVVQQYTSIVGLPAMMPYWALGFHNCKWGYSSLTEVQAVVANYSAAKIPLDTQWMDIDYMMEYRDFTYDNNKFPVAEVNEFINELHNQGQHFIPIVDPGIMVYKNQNQQGSYEPYDRGMEEDLFVKDLTGTSPYLGQVWPGPVHFPDFFHPKTQAYWTDELKQFLSLANADGIWIDMNEVSNFCNIDGNGQICHIPSEGNCPNPDVEGSQTKCCLECETIDPTNQYDFPPYPLHNFYHSLSGRTLPVSAKHYSNISAYNSHNLYGLMEQIATNQALTSITDKRPFVLSRSSFLSTGVHSAKWTGDNAASWEDLQSSIVSMLDFNLFGVPMIGSDICGFDRNTTEELCARWMELGAFYPFSRAHNAIHMNPQEPYLWTSVTAASQSALAIRYALLPTLYTLFYRAHTTGTPVIQSLWMLDPLDVNTITIDRQFLWGDKLLISPVVTPKTDFVTAYFPQGYWYDYFTQGEDHLHHQHQFIDASKEGLYTRLYTPLTKIQIHIKGGSILPLQQSALTTTIARTTPFTLVVALCPQGQAKGELYWDDGVQPLLTKYLLVSYNAHLEEEREGIVSSTIIQNTYPIAKELLIEEIVVLGNQLVNPTSVFLNGHTISSAQVIVNKAGNSLHFMKLHVSIASAFTLQWKF